ncbi:MAG: PIG-L family deacetylase [Bacillota bacterium]|nr:PIG-L family deacetylase [Bacillota bacterium]
MPYRLLCVTAHPDDESGAFGGALLLAHAQGALTSVVCLTEGSAGSFRGEGTSDEELARIRRQEMAAAAKVLGITHSEVMHFPDGALDRQDFFELVAVLVAKVRAFRPHVVLTFGGEGGVNLHRDHTVVSLATTAAFHWAARSAIFPDAGPPYAPQKLYYSSPPFISVFQSNEGADTARVPHSLTLELGKWKEKKIEAFRQHVTQHGVLERVSSFIDKAFGYERYLLAASKSEDLLEDTGLFAGVTED